MTNYYEILGISPQADLSEIKTAYRKLSKKFHPDLNSNDPFFEGMFLRIQEAYEVLSNAEARKKFDDLLNRGNSLKRSVLKSTAEYPIIKNFSTDKTTIAEGETFTLTWNVENADIVEIKPFGKFPSKGVESFKFNQLNLPQINLIITAQNTETGSSARDYLTLQNTSYKESIFQNLFNQGYGILVIKIMIILLIIAFIILIFTAGIEVNDPLQDLNK